MILASIKPYYYYLIAEEKKKIEVRKTAFKNLPQDIAFYMSKDEKSFTKIPKEFQEKYRKHFGKVGMRVVCDKVDEYNFHEGLTEFNSMGLPSRIYGSYLIFADEYKAMCLSYDEVKNYGKHKTLYGWHISDLKIYDKPKELSEFRKSGFMTEEEWLFNLYPNTHCHYDAWAKKFEIIRPPQSYMFVEEVER
jgi:hypothetical protein|nr:MAG TPA: helix-turn-helix domain-containing protein [Caudoviricetes sp.]